MGALCFDRAIAIKPDYVEALVNRSMVLASLTRMTRRWRISKRS